MKIHEIQPQYVQNLQNIMLIKASLTQNVYSTTSFFDSKNYIVLRAAWLGDKNF